MKKLLLIATIIMSATTLGQNVLSPEILLKLNRVSVVGITKDKKSIIYKVATPSVAENNSSSKMFTMPISGGTATEIKETKNLLADKNVSPNGKYVLSSNEVKIDKVLGKDYYPELQKSDVQIYDALNYRHWDTWNEGLHNHVFFAENNDKAKPIDIMANEPFDAPQKPHGGSEDFVWSPDSSKVLYVCKKKSGKDYATSTNTDIYAYDLASGRTENWTEGMMGYDVNPKFSPDGKSLLWQSMARDGYEADKNDIVVMDLASKKITNLTKSWDESVVGVVAWSPDSKNIYFSTAYRGVKQLFHIGLDGKVKQISGGNFDVNEIIAFQSGNILVTRTDINHNADLFKVNVKDGSMLQLTSVNESTYAKLSQGKSELKMVKTSDGKEMGVWFHYPPNFDPNKKYPTLLYCQGGPQSALTQFFSTRWNFALMAANDYIVVAPNRRGMPGWGTKWNEDISKDWGGQPIRDYLAAADFAKTLPYVDGDRMAAVGASYGGYSVFMLAGVHENRFKTFIAHDGLFDMKSWYGTTEELWFANWDLGSPWEKPLPKAYTDFNPINFVDQWNKPIMVIQGGLDFRVGYEQGQEAFQAAKMKGLKTKFLYFPNENHWVLHPQNGLVWQREFFDWLKETL